LTFDPILVEKIASLMHDIMQDNPNISRLYLTGAFYFIMMYTGSNVLPVARFLKYTHVSQAFRSDEVKHSFYCEGLWEIKGTSVKNDALQKLKSITYMFSQLMKAFPHKIITAYAVVGKEFQLFI
jgi:hypothetical protein